MWSLGALGASLVCAVESNRIRLLWVILLIVFPETRYSIRLSRNTDPLMLYPTSRTFALPVMSTEELC